MISQRFTLNFEYPVYFTEGVFDAPNPLLSRILRAKEPLTRHRVVFVIDRNVSLAWPGLEQSIVAYVEAHAEHIEIAGEPVIIPGGEDAKNDPGVLHFLHERLHAWAIDRHSFVLGLGGGAVLDVVGYAAATAHRGVRCLRMPTTVLAQADAGIGVKNGINAFGKKNFLGTFAPPFAVLCDSRFLRTLPTRDARAGYAEAVKVALLKDPVFFRQIQERAASLRQRESEAMEWLIRRAAELHLEHIATAGDPFELGSARPLDFGHWAAHKLEALTAHRLTHGEAVAIGMALDSVYSSLIELCDARLPVAVLHLLQELGLPSWDDALEKAELIQGLREFREHLGGDLNVTLLSGVGAPVQVVHMDEAMVAAAVRKLRQYGNPL